MKIFQLVLIFVFVSIIYGNSRFDKNIRKHPNKWFSSLMNRGKLDFYKKLTITLEPKIEWCLSPEEKFSGYGKRNGLNYNFTIDFKEQTIVYKYKTTQGPGPITTKQVDYATRKLHTLTSKGKCTSTRLPCHEIGLPRELIPTYFYSVENKTVSGIVQALFYSKRFEMAFIKSAPSSKSTCYKLTVVCLYRRSIGKIYHYDPEMPNMEFDATKCKDMKE